jgi:hypothetical protein
MRLGLFSTARCLVGLSFVAFFPLSTHAHEPLWGETPQTFAFGVIHPEVRVGKDETRFGLQYAFSTTRNLRLELPQSRLNGQNGQIGDMSLSLKSRLHVQFGPDFKQMSAAIIGVDRHSTQLGYAFAHERLTDTIWASAMYTKKQTEIDAAYGYWIKRAHTPSDTGIITAIGLHRETMSHIAPLAGVHASLIVTKGQMQARVGVLYPHTGKPQVRLGFEILL